MRWPHLPALVVAGLLASLPACSDQEVVSGNPVHTAAASTATSTTVGTGGAGGAGGAGAAGGAGGQPAGLADVTLVHGADSAKVDAATLPTVEVNGVAVVKLSVVWAAGHLAEGTTDLVFDFEGDDGFHPSNKDKCAPYIPYAELAQGYVIPETRSLVWDDALGLPGCYGVKAVAKIIALDAP